MGWCSPTAQCSASVRPARVDMPRRPAFRSDVLADLDRQLAFAPESVQRKRLESAETLLKEVDASRAYPMEFIVFRLTGYRPDEARDEQVAGDALRGDLVTMIQVASRRCPLPWDGPRGRPLSQDEVAARLGRSKRSLQRLRHRGLVFWWTRPSKGALRLGCPPDMFNWFNANCHEAPSQRINEATRASIEALAQMDDLRALPMAHRVREVAARVDVTVDVARGVLRRAVEAGRLPPTAKGRLVRRDARLALRAYRRGVAVSTLAKRLDITVPSVHRALRREQLAMVRRCLARGLVGMASTAGSKGNCLPGPPLLWTTEFVLPGRTDVADQAALERLAEACGVAHSAYKSCTSRSGSEQWSVLEAAMVNLTRHWWGVLCSLGSVLEGAIAAWAGRPFDQVPQGVLRRVLPALVDEAAMTLSRLQPEDVARLEGRVRSGSDRLLISAGRIHERSGQPHGGRVLMLRHTPWRLLLPDPRWERAVKLLPKRDSALAVDRFALQGRPLLSLEACALSHNASTQAIAARTGWLRRHLHKAAVAGAAR